MTHRDADLNKSKVATYLQMRTSNIHSHDWIEQRGSVLLINRAT